MALGSRAFVFFALTAFSLGTALAVVLVDPSLGEFFTANRVASGPRYILLALALGSTGAAIVLTGGYAYRHRDDRSMPERLLAVAERTSPLMLTGFVPVLLRPKTWAAQPLTFLALTAMLVFTAGKTLELARRRPSLELERRLRDQLQKTAAPLARAHRALPSLPFALVAAGTLAYVVYFSYYTIVFHQGVYSSFDLGIKNNIFWNTLHGNPFKASVTLGPDGPSHFGRHADVLVYFLLPIYYFWQTPEMILVLQALFMGGAAIPLYLLASRRLGSWCGALVAGSYLLHPALHGGNLFEFHFIGFGLPLLFGAWAAYERKRLRLAAALAVLTLLTREDVALWVAVVGAYLFVAGTDPRVGLFTAGVSLVYFVLIKFWLMPRFGGESFADYYEGLPPEGDLTFKGVLVTLIGNPAFTLSTLLKEQKLIFLLQIFLPLALLPLSRPVFALLALPGFLFTILSPDYTPLFDIAFQYGAHFLAFAYPGLILALDCRRRRAPNTTAEVLEDQITIGKGDHAPRECAGEADAGGLWLGSDAKSPMPTPRTEQPQEPTKSPRQTQICRSRTNEGLSPLLFAVACGTLATSFQFGAVLQQQTAFAGPRPFLFGTSEEGEKRRAAVLELAERVPDDAKIACSNLIAPQFSSREDAYDMTQGFFDAEYLIFAVHKPEIRDDEKGGIRSRLAKGKYGVVAVSGPFALAKRGHSTAKNRGVLDRLGSPLAARFE